MPKIKITNALMIYTIKITENTRKVKVIFELAKAISAIQRAIKVINCLKVELWKS